MSFRFLSRAGLLAGLIATGFALPASATSFDGNWSVSIVTTNGGCDHYRYPVKVSGGRLIYEGSAPVKVSGTVASSGAVTVNLAVGEDKVAGSGKIANASGGGTWKAPSRGCSGKWTAERE